MKIEAEAVNSPVTELTEDELTKVSGGMLELDEAVLFGTVMGHLMNAHQSATKTQNDKLITMISNLQNKCLNREFAEIVSQISALLPSGVYDSSDKDAYDSLKKAKETIENSGILDE